MEADQRNALDIGQPDGSDIFTETGDNQISSSWQVFDASTMGYNPGLTNNWHSHSLVTVDQREGEYHICFMHDPDTHRGGGSSMNFIEDLGTTMYRRALALHESDKKSSHPSNDGGFSMKGLLSSVMIRRAQNNFIFISMCVRSTRCKEHFVGWIWKWVEMIFMILISNILMLFQRLSNKLTMKRRCPRSRQKDVLRLDSVK